MLDLTDELIIANPDVISILIGTNDFGNVILNRSAIDVGDRIIAIVERLSKFLPDTKIYLHTLLPRGVEDSGVDLRPRIKELNKLIKSNAPKNIELIDLWPIFVGEDDLSLAEDFLVEGESILRLHLNKKGYSKWQEILLPKLRQAKAN